MSSERLAALLRQRALVSQHLAWLDAEILAASGAAASAPPALSVPPTGSPEPAYSMAAPVEPSEPAPSPALAAANARADEIIEKYRATEALNPAETRRGCLMLFSAILLFGTAIVLGIYLLHYR